jgi:hypothetical protein
LLLSVVGIGCTIFQWSVKSLTVRKHVQPSPWLGMGLAKRFT